MRPRRLLHAAATMAVVMLGMNLATLSIPELRRVLDMARARDQADLVESVLRELRTRGGPRTGAAADDLPAMTFGASEPPRVVAAGLREAPWWEEEAAAAPAPRRRAPRLLLLVAMAAVAGGLGWGVTLLAASHDDRPAPPPLRAATIAAAPAPASIPTPDTEAPSAQREAAPVATAEAAAPPAPPASAKPARKPASCATRATPADRLVCGYPTLARQHERLLAAYNRAVASGGDPLVLDAEQARWRAGRDRISDRRQLADAYQQRIDALNAVADRPQPEARPADNPPAELPVF